MACRDFRKSMCTFWTLHPENGGELDSKKPAMESIDAYIASAPKNTRALLKEMRKTIRDAAPEAAEKISYQMPTFWLNGNLVHFAAYAGHIGFYPAPSGISRFSKQLAGFKGAKGSVQFPLDQPLPLGLIAEIVRFRVKENKANEKKTSGKSPKAPAKGVRKK
jgi:uncharacterized protein YdhG (YjbR/CyaY superfamily)